MHLHLDWEGELRFTGSAGDTPVRVDGDAVAAASPVQQLATGLAGCMAIDVVHTLAKMRTPATTLSVDMTITRADVDPRRVVAAEMTFLISGDVPAKNVGRAIELSRQTYCSVWHSLRADIELDTDFEIRAD